MYEKSRPSLRQLESEMPAPGNRDSTSLTQVNSSFDKDRKQQNAKLANPLYDMTEEELYRDVESFVERTGLRDIQDLLRKAALVAQDRNNFERLPQLDEEEKQYLREETTHKWRQTKMLYYQVFMCSMAAVVQGMDETVINGANLFYPDQFGIGTRSQHDTLLVGLVNSAPYLCSAVCSCWLTYPLNRWLGRRGAIFVSTLFAGLCCIWSGVTNSWAHLFVARFVLGFGIGPKSATVPILTAEIAPARIRGALVMQWQVWTAFGIMLGTVSSLIFQKIPDKPGITGLNWRLMLGSACLPAIIVCAQVFFTPESPRWLMGQGKWDKAWQSLLRLRRSPIQAAVDLYYTAKLLEVEDEIQANAKRSRAVQLIAEPRNRRAMLASTIVMFGQQFCGVNAIAYYSSNIFSRSIRSMLINLSLTTFSTRHWTFALPAFFTIDTFGRRSLLLFTFPFLSITLVIAGCGFLIKSNPQAQLAFTLLGWALCVAVFYPNETSRLTVGCFASSLSAEAYPLQVREIGMALATASKSIGMALATATTWLFNFVVALTFPLLLVSFTSTGAFCWFAGWNALLFFLVLLFLPETKQRSAFSLRVAVEETKLTPGCIDFAALEELDEVFSMSTRRLALYGAATPWYQFQRIALRRKIKRTALEDYMASEEKDTPEIQHREDVKV
ncbi:SPOSA6832_01603 [Sporobolomyces salmonicolor]|uniref:SPOSA6832_01603-mRNA-1:cds n=1 Tax=Sporidiobolus salmonicolor TaxID=5005 RepID=A0A0D6EJ23_SPOSA|nr:SPOSA6832_01603 [Sporobolomyces salmonicolor]